MATLRIPRPLFILAVLLAAVPASVRAQEPLPADSAGASGDTPPNARRRARSGAIRGFIAGVAPLLIYHAIDDDPRVGWTLAVGGSALQVASIAHSTAGCLDRR